MTQEAKWSSLALGELATACDALLREEPIDVGRMAIPALHFRSAHPNALAVYQPLLASEPIVTQSLRERVAGWRDRLSRVGLRTEADDHPRRADILFVSHLLSPQQAARPEHDLYFGDLPQVMAANGYACATALIDHTDGCHRLADWQTLAEAPRVVLRQRLSRNEESDIARQLEQTASRLEKGTSHRRLRRLASWQARTGATRHSVRIGRQIGDLVGRLQPRALVLTYEGHAWERLAMRAARKAGNGLTCCAVHHAVLAPMQYAMQRRYGADFDPDHIFTAGHIAHRWLRGCADLSELPIDVLGSPRAIARQDGGAKRGQGATCLFLPEGLRGESLRLTRSAHMLAVARPDLSCVIRLHPLMTRERLEAMAPELARAPDNFHWSPVGRPLNKDTACARWAVYRGSSAILAAIADGVEPVYLGDEPAELSIDPLRTRSGFGRIAPSDQDLTTMLHSGAYNKSAQLAGQEYARRYYTPLDPDVLIGSLASAF